MFDVSFGELMLIGVIALIVIGPQRLPKVARTIGHLVGRAQRYVGNVKADIQREMDLEEFSKLKREMEDAARSANQSINEVGDNLRKPLDDVQSTFETLSADLRNAAPALDTQPDTPAAVPAPTPATKASVSDEAATPASPPAGPETKSTSATGSST